MSRNVGKTRVATLNVGTLTGRSCELVEALERRRVDFCAVQEMRWSCRKSRDIGRGFKTVLCGSPRTTSGVGVIVSERFRDSIVSVDRFDDRLMKIVVAAKEQLYHFFSAYAPQTGCSDQAKDEFWSLLDEKTAEVPSKDVVIVAGDLNGHVGATKDGYSCHGGFVYGSRNADGERALEYAESHNLTIVNTIFRKRDPHLISYYSGSFKAQTDFVLVKDRDRSLVTDAKTYAMMKPRLSGLGLNKTLTENQQGTTLPENFVLLEVASEVMRETLVKRCSRSKSSQLRNAIYTMLAIVMSYLVCNGVHIFLTFLERTDEVFSLLYDSDDPNQSSNFYIALSDTVSICYMVSSAVRILIYAKCNTKLRQEISDYLRDRKTLPADNDS
ncbi:unnamed protein product [Heligmosomoides polygyrus]|uniref:Endo/exonuclease/phosphatase domain-containing protein n=1 Tax=Heligmosomoides polygyrus TaxID=6339 RepID=A0A183FE21_HELPZ|nr:unnamed protein product [Heligmosomoides polygyrus]